PSSAQGAFPARRRLLCSNGKAKGGPVFTVGLFILYRFALALTATSALFAASASPAEAQIFNRRSNAETAQVVNEAPRCTQNLGTVAIAETQGVLFEQMGLGEPTELLRTVIRDSGC